jgi:hypothetical protein
VGFSAITVRGSCAFDHTSSDGEETVNFMSNGIFLNHLRFISISSVQDFKIDNLAFSAEHG